MNDNFALQFITHRTERYSYVDSARMALEGGCRWVQLRMKSAKAELLEATALEVQAMCRSCGATFIIDDDVMLAKRIGADGVHLGKDDMSVTEARQLLGAECIIGATVNTFNDIMLYVHSSEPDYFGCGPFRFTTTKQRLAPTLGLEGYRNIMEQMHCAGITIPLVAIGGITLSDISDLMATGVSGIALSSSVLDAPCPERKMREIVELLR